jgi:hypothetical protein
MWPDHSIYSGCEEGSTMNSSISLWMTVAFCILASPPVFAEVKTCTFEKVILRSHYSDNKETCTRTFGESFEIDTAKNILNIQWSDGASGWFAPHKVKKNSRFTNYLLYHEITVTDIEQPLKRQTKNCTITYRLYADGTRAEAHFKVHNFEPRAARYRCK